MAVISAYYEDVYDRYQLTLNFTRLGMQLSLECLFNKEFWSNVSEWDLILLKGMRMICHGENGGFRSEGLNQWC